MEVFAGRSTDLEAGDRILVEHKDQHSGVLRAKGVLHAFFNLCPYQGSPACEGVLVHKPEEIIAEDRSYQGMRFTEDLHLVCPWHGWEFNVETGRCADDGKHGLRKFAIVEREGDIYVVV
ncbi:Rieske 2Fe-2S domain-containing protein [Tardiphaga sp. vice154]|uniref:Rieske (2Fe-2S) protein n=1 Tax=Tardiphaga sp. vice154 TaxID=2592814 RepID=UPI0011624673|nr:Rieske 2Fe-2S domain-containing protein [Tardiphaga sp. vice154]QDM20777.1 Rieske 2Fe-2S domain-containing protein [Tardiphaga sp. vice154]